MEEEVDGMKALIVWVNLILCGFIAISISFFFAEGAIAENYTNERFVAPQFFLIIPIWVAGVFLMWQYFRKNNIDQNSYKKIILVSLSLWLTIPIGVWFSGLFS